MWICEPMGHSLYLDRDFSCNFFLYVWEIGGIDFFPKGDKFQGLQRKDEVIWDDKVTILLQTLYLISSCISSLWVFTNEPICQVLEWKTKMKIASCPSVLYG